MKRISYRYYILLLASVGIWLAENFDFKLNLVKDNSESILGFIGKLFVPIFKWTGLNDWRLCSALLSGFIAKENI